MEPLEQIAIMLLLIYVVIAFASVFLILNIWDLTVILRDWYKLELEKREALKDWKKKV